MKEREPRPPREPRLRPPRAGRHPARRVALQTLFEIDFNRADPKETWERGSFRTGLTENAAAFAWQLIEGVMEHKKALDEEIQQLAPEFPITQMAPVDRNVLRIALYELRVLGDAPAAAIIDEAVELAKMFGSEVAPKFVNGVLATAVGGRKDAAP